MGFDGWAVPDWAKPYVGWVVGMDWPEGDETGCFRLADACVTAAHGLVEGTAADQPGSADKIGSDWDGDAHLAFAKYVAQVAGGRLGDLVNRLINTAVALNGVGVQIQYAKYMIEVTVWLLIAQIGYLLAAALASGGASLALIPPRVALARMTVAQIAKRTLLNIAMFAGIVAGMDAGIQLTQLAKGRRDELDLKQIGISALTGGAMGGMMGLLSGGLTRLATPALRAGLTRAEMTTAERLLSAASSSLYGQAGQYAVTGGITTAGTMLAQGNFSWDMLAKGITSSALGADGQHLTTSLPNSSSGSGPGMTGLLSDPYQSGPAHSTSGSRDARSEAGPGADSGRTDTGSVSTSSRAAEPVSGAGPADTGSGNVRSETSQVSDPGRYTTLSQAADPVTDPGRQPASAAGTDSGTRVPSPQEAPDRPVTQTGGTTVTAPHASQAPHAATDQGVPRSGPGADAPVRGRTPVTPVHATDSGAAPTARPAERGEPAPTRQNEAPSSRQPATQSDGVPARQGSDAVPAHDTVPARDGVPARQEDDGASAARRPVQSEGDTGNRRIEQLLNHEDRPSGTPRDTAQTRTADNGPDPAGPGARQVAPTVHLGADPARPSENGDRATARPSDGAENAANVGTRGADPQVPHRRDGAPTARDGAPATADRGPAARDGARDADGAPRDGARAADDSRPALVDPTSGRALTERDLRFLNLTDEQVRWWSDQEAPLGMRPEEFREFRSSLADVLDLYGVRPEDVRVLLVGSAVRGWSGWTKTMDNIPHTPESEAILRAWLGDDPGPTRRPFDVMDRLGLGKPSDYDLGFHSDRMVEIARARWEAEGSPGEFSHKYGFVDKNLFREAFPELHDWANEWGERVGRKVGGRLFGLENEPLQRRSSNSSSKDEAWVLDLTPDVPVPDTGPAPALGPWPADPANGYQIRPRDMDFLGYTEDMINWWRSREAPMGMTPEQFRGFRAELLQALVRDGVDLERIDVRLKGSSINFFSNQRKSLPTLEDLADNPASAEALRQWLGDDTERPASRPFDSMYKLGLDDARSDYDIQIRSDDMVDLARKRYESHPPGDLGYFSHAKYDFVAKSLVNTVFPHLDAWVRKWEGELGREVAPALFGLDSDPRQPRWLEAPDRGWRGWPILGPDAPPIEAPVRPEPENAPPAAADEGQASADAAPPVSLDRTAMPLPEVEPSRIAPDGSWHWKGLSLPAETNAAVDTAMNYYREARDGTGESPGIRDRLTDIEQWVPGARMEGLEHDLKSADRLKEKVADRLETRPGAAATDILRDIADAVRYTYAVDTENYVVGVQRIQAEMRAAGFDQEQFRNFWTYDDNPYQGINTRWRDPASNVLFEVQFHTRESLEAKTLEHDVYEILKTAVLSEEERNALEQYRQQLYSRIPLPEGIRELAP
ncbi:hypothetical protein [Nonomuraea pusilla]|uniref:Outer membrane channel protein CpnT-like N-terminal domain-containing protein n=1 Tax=Nonomuraea pusilla TaxID=46177 RepID=A0A1H7U6E8_9ACTN|nr:hypothetical protein [Nonomuraea pusilla]SEL92369.1 hypothetical protein SAMN05660976_03680 [Nonomuraea pusilla]